MDDGGRTRITPSRIAPPPPETHYSDVVEESDHLVVFLGAGVNTEDCEEAWQEGSGYLPDDRELARCLAKHLNWSDASLDLAEIAQRARALRGDARVFGWIRSVLAVDSDPRPVHSFLAELPKRLEGVRNEAHYPMIVTPKYDLALERAFRALNVEFDVALFMGPEAEHRGRFVHVPWDNKYIDPTDVKDWNGRSPIPVTVGNKYNSFPIVSGAYGGELKRTVIVHLNGTVDDELGGFPWTKNYVITEDHYIDYMSDGTVEEIVPGQVLAQLTDSSHLFLGYSIADWRLRVFLKRVFKGETLGSTQHWAIEREPDELEDRLWKGLGVTLYQIGLSDYIAGFDEPLPPLPR
jgi:hypothetical protein